MKELSAVERGHMPTKFPRLKSTVTDTKGVVLTRDMFDRAKTRVTGPTINRGKGNNNAATPWKFIHPVEAKFGKLEWDLAASESNTKAQHFITEAQDSLKQTWQHLGGLCFLNPPFTNITVWARKCAEEVQLGARILLLVPASVGANWYWDWVVPYADVYSVGRMGFDDCYDKHGKLITDPYPKDLILCHYGWKGDHPSEEGRGVIYRWRWQDA